MVTFGRLQQSSCELSCTNEFFLSVVGHQWAMWALMVVATRWTWLAPTTPSQTRCAHPPYSTLQANICAHYVAQREVA